MAARKTLTKAPSKSPIRRSSAVQGLVLLDATQREKFARFSFCVDLALPKAHFAKLFGRGTEQEGPLFAGTVRTDTEAAVIITRLPEHRVHITFEFRKGKTAPFPKMPGSTIGAKLHAVALHAMAIHLVHVSYASHFHLAGDDDFFEKPFKVGSRELYRGTTSVTYNDKPMGQKPDYTLRITQTPDHVEHSESHRRREKVGSLDEARDLAFSLSLNRGSG